MENRIIDNKVEDITSAFRKKIVYHDDVIWIKLKGENLFGELERTSIYFTSSSQSILDLIKDLPYGGVFVSNNWYRYNNYKTAHSSEFIFLSKPNPIKEQRFIRSLKLFPNNGIQVNSFEDQKVCEWGTTTVNNLMLMFISHLYYASPRYLKKSKTYDEEVAKAAYQIRSLLSKSDRIYNNNDCLLNKYVPDNQGVISKYVKVEALR